MAAVDARSERTKEQELIIARVFDAPRDLVFRMWTELEHLSRWCCPAGFTIPVAEGELRAGGSFRTCMRAPDGEEHWLGGRYLEIAPPERLVFTHAWQDEHGRPGLETTVTVTLREEGGKTLLTLHQAPFATASSRDGHIEGWTESLDGLERYIAR